MPEAAKIVLLIIAALAVIAYLRGFFGAAIEDWQKHRRNRR